MFACFFWSDDGLDSKIFGANADATPVAMESPGTPPPKYVASRLMSSICAAPAAGNSPPLDRPAPTAPRYGRMEEPDNPDQPSAPVKPCSAAVARSMSPGPSPDGPMIVCGKSANNWSIVRPGGPPPESIFAMRSLIVGSDATSSPLRIDWSALSPSAPPRRSNPPAAPAAASPAAVVPSPATVAGAVPPATGPPVGSAGSARNARGVSCPRKSSTVGVCSSRPRSPKRLSAMSPPASSSARSPVSTSLNHRRIHTQRARYRRRHRPRAGRGIAGPRSGARLAY